MDQTSQISSLDLFSVLLCTYITREPLNGLSIFWRKYANRLTSFLWGTFVFKRLNDFLAHFFTKWRSSHLPQRFSLFLWFCFHSKTSSSLSILPYCSDIYLFVCFLITLTYIFVSLKHFMVYVASLKCKNGYIKNRTEFVGFILSVKKKKSQRKCNNHCFFSYIIPLFSDWGSK